MTTEILSVVIVVLQLANFTVMCVAIRQGRKLEKFWEKYKGEKDA